MHFGTFCKLEFYIQLHQLKHLAETIQIKRLNKALHWKEAKLRTTPVFILHPKQV